MSRRFYLIFLDQKTLYRWEINMGALKQLRLTLPWQRVCRLESELNQGVHFKIEASVYELF